jgi:microcin C transport system permease protein
LIYGLRTSLLFGIILTVISSFIGIIIGATSGYLGGKFDLTVQRIIEIWSGLPMIFILIIMTSFITANFWWLIIIMILFSWINLVIPVRAEFLKARKLEYVTAARSLGVSEKKIILKHILPNALIASVTFIPFIITSSIISLTALDFLGFGMPAGSASLGELLEQGRNNPHAIWLSLSSFISLTIILTLIIFIGEGIRDAINDKNNTE